MERFGTLVVIGEAPRSNRGMRKVLCQCDCGKQKAIRYDSLKRGDSKSCGCVRDKQVGDRFRTHGKKGTPIYQIWYSMRQRCRDIKHLAWDNYGGRGISVCERWQSFGYFYTDMGDAPFAGAQLDRIDNNGNYSPENCRWVDCKTNSRNKRNNHILEYMGQRKPVAEWCEDLGLSYPVIKARIIKGWSTERALTTPVRDRYGRLKVEYT